nr:retrovirus-related Pol polyprotein from transposon TNT 1-94 [Tanacetum cinerariifolium]
MAGHDDNGDHPETSNTSPPVPPNTTIPHTVSSIKLLILKKGNMNGNGHVSVRTDTNEMIKVLPPKTAEEVMARERERKARTTLLMALPKDHLAKFPKLADGKEMWESIKSRFVGLHKGYDRFQTLLSQLEIHGAGVSHEDANQSFDDIYNNLRVFERDVKGTIASSSNTQNVAFVSIDNTSSTNNINDDDMEDMDLKWQVAMISIRIKKFHIRIGRKLQFDTKDPVGFDKTKVECFNCHKMGHFARDCRAKWNQDSRRRDDGYNGNKTRDNVPPPITGNYMPSGPDVEIDYSKFTYGLKQTSTAESDSKPSEYASCESDSSVKTSTSMPEQVENASKVLYKPKVWTDAPIIEEYESDSDNDLVSNVQEDKEKHSFANSIKHVKTSRENIKETGITIYSPKIEKHDRNGHTRKGLGYAFTRKACFDDPHRALKDKGIVDIGCSRHMTRNKAHLTDYQEFKGGSIAFGGSSGRITGKGKIKAGRLDFEDVYYVEELKQYNLFSVSQMCDKKNKVLFTDTDCLLLPLNFKLPDENQVLLKIPRQHNMYSFNLKNIDPYGHFTCLFAKALIDESNKWHRRLGQINFKSLNKLVKGNLVRGLPSKIFENDHTCVACQKGKQHKASCMAKTVSSVNQPLQILNRDLFRPTSDETTPILKDFIRQPENQFNHKVKTIRSDNRIEFKNKDLIELCGLKEAVNTACYVLNMVLVTKPQNKTPYELLTGKQPIISYLRPFGCHVTILNTIDQLGKFDGKSDSGFLVGYSLNSKAFRVYNLETKRVEDNMHVNFLENKTNIAGKGHAWMFDLDYLTNSMNYKHDSVENQANKSAGPKEANNSAGTQANDDQGANSKEIKLNEEHFVLPIWSAYSTTVKSSGDKLERTLISRHEKEANDAAESLRKEATHYIQNANTSSTNLLNTISTPLSTAGLSRAFNDGELSYLDDLSMLTLRIFMSVQKAIGTKWVYKNKKDERGVVVRIRLAQGHRQEEEIDYDVVFTHMARIETIRIFLAFASFMGFIVYHMDVKSAFLYGTIDEEVYVSQPLGFVDPKFPKKVYKVVKALYGIHRAPRAWYATFSTFLEKSRYRRGAIDKTLFIKQDKKDIMLVQVYVDDIIFGSTKKSLCDEFEELMKNMFQMTYMGELTFFLGLQVKQKEDGIFISQGKYVAEILKKFDFLSVKTASTPIETHKLLVKVEEAADVDVHLYRSRISSLMYLTASRPNIMFVFYACSRFQVTSKSLYLEAMKRIFRYPKGQLKLGLWYPKVSSFNMEAYSDSDYAGANLDIKSTTGVCQFLGKRLISWQCKKQTIVATSTTEAEYIATTHCCG